MRGSWRHSVAAAALLGIGLGSLGLGAARAQAGEEVPFITTPDHVTLAMLQLARVGPRDHVLDLGSGDGRIVITAARRFGASGLGVEIDPALVTLSQDNARKAGVQGRAEFREQDLFKTDLGAASVITMYLLQEVNLQLRPALLALKPGTRLVSHDWDMGDWQPDRTVVLPVPDKAVGREKFSRVHLWVVPAPVQGLWCGPQGRWLRVQQQYQAASASAGEGPAAGPAASVATAAAAVTQGTAAKLGQAAKAVHRPAEHMAGLLAQQRHAWGRVDGARLQLAAADARLTLQADSSRLRVAGADGAWASWRGQALVRASGDACPAP